MKKPIKPKPPTDAEEIRAWLVKNPKICRIIAERAVLGLLITGASECIIEDGGDYESAADYLEHVEQGIISTPLHSLIKRLQRARKKRPIRVGDHIVVYREWPYHEGVVIKVGYRNDNIQVTLDDGRSFDLAPVNYDVI